MLYQFIFVISTASALVNDEGSFWQITDIHWDLLYNEHGDVNNMCHKLMSQKDNASLGYFGNYMCDSPFTLINSSLLAMKKWQPNPQFILWTGDNAPHTKNLSFDIILKTMKNLTKEILKTYDGNVPLIPVLGNHDTFPKDDYPASGENFYERYLTEGGWGDVIPNESHQTFLRGGYYIVDVSPSMQVMVLNTNLYYRYNRLGENLHDPSRQFEWIVESLRRAARLKKKVIVAAHAPPGYWERNAKTPFFNDSYNDRFLDILDESSNVILAHIYGHEHTDSFRLFGSLDGIAKSVGFLAPSLTPWFPSRLEGGTAINPSLRLFSYKGPSVTGYTQFHMNLTEANKESSNFTSCGSLPTVEESKKCFSSNAVRLWKVYYESESYLNFNGLNAETLTQFYGRLILNDTLFQKYVLFNSAGVNHGHCDNSCKRNHLCAIRFQKISDMALCLDLLSDFRFISHSQQLLEGVLDSDESGNNRRYSIVGHSVLILLSIATLALLILGSLIICSRRRRRQFFQSDETLEFARTQHNQGYKPIYA